KSIDVCYFSYNCVLLCFYRVSEFLTNLDTLAANHSYFQPGITLESLERIPKIYKSLIEDPIAVRDHFRNLSSKCEISENIVKELNYALTQIFGLEAC